MPQVWRQRHHSLIPGRGRDFSFLQSAHASSDSHPASCSVGMGVAWHEADHPCPFTVVLRLSVCVWSWTSTPLHGTHRNNFTDCTENTELDSCLKCGFYTLIVELFFLPWIGCCIFLRVCMKPSNFHCHTVGTV